MSTDADGEDSPAPEPEELPQPGAMLPKEQQTGYIIAGAIGVLVLILGISRQINHSKGAHLGYMALGLAGAGAMAFAAHRGRRIFASIVSILGGLALVGFPPLNFVFLFYGAYMMFKQSQAQKKLNKAGVPRARRQPRARGEAARRGGAAPADNRPKANRRYTPPKTSKTAKRTR